MLTGRIASDVALTEMPSLCLQASAKIEALNFEDNFSLQEGEAFLAW